MNWLKSAPPTLANFLEYNFIKSMTKFSTTPPEPGDNSAGPEELLSQLREAHFKSDLETIKYALRNVPEGPQDSDPADVQSHSGLAGDVGSAELMASSRQAIVEIHKTYDLGLGGVVELTRPAQATNKPKNSITPIRPANVTSIEDIRRIVETQCNYGDRGGDDAA